MIAHDGPRLGTAIRDASSMLSLVIASIMSANAKGFRPKLNPGRYKHPDPIDKVANQTFEVSVWTRSGRRVNPAAERLRLRKTS